MSPNNQLAEVSRPLSEVRKLLADCPFMIVVLREDGTREMRVTYASDEELSRLCEPAVSMSTALRARQS